MNDPLSCFRETVAAERGAHLRGGRQAEGLMAAVAGEAAWFGGAKRVAEPGCERSERRILADARSVSARTSYSTVFRITPRDYSMGKNPLRLHFLNDPFQFTGSRSGCDDRVSMAK